MSQAETQALLYGRVFGLWVVFQCVSTTGGFWRGVEGRDSSVTNLLDFLGSRTELTERENWIKVGHRAFGKIAPNS